MPAGNLNSFRLFKLARSGLQMIKYLSHRHKLQQFEAGLKGVYPILCRFGRKVVRRLGRKDVWFLSFQYAIFFCNMVRAVISKRMDKRSHTWPRSKLIFEVSLFFLYIYCLPSTHSFRSLLGQTFKGERACSASRLDSAFLKRGERRGL